MVLTKHSINDLNSTISAAVEGTGCIAESFRDERTGTIKVIIKDKETGVDLDTLVFTRNDTFSRIQHDVRDSANNAIFSRSPKVEDAPYCPCYTCRHSCICRYKDRVCKLFSDNSDIVDEKVVSASCNHYEEEY